ncbi:MAG: ABC transporter permease [Candidatus Cloacimonetes bacterium]|nr:ABC transporter permease [Candidatus Cloacimonadota bacterium]
MSNIKVLEQDEFLKKISSQEIEEDSQKVEYWDIVWAQFKKNKLAMFGLYSILAIVLIAIYAPFISLNKPIYVVCNGEWDFPLFASLFDQNFFQNGVDLFFNLQIFLLPLFLLLIFVKVFVMMDPFFRFFPKFLAIYFGLSIVGFLLIYQGGHQVPYKDWTEIIQKKRMNGQIVDVLMPFNIYSYRQPNVNPGMNPAPPNSKQILGTDTEGRDVFARMIYGTRISLTIGLIAVSMYISIGIVLGALAGFFGGVTDIVISRLIEIMLCFPTFFLILTLLAMVNTRSIFYVMIIIGFTRWPEVARLVRAEFFKLKSMDYVQAAIALGFTKGRIIFGHVLPNALGPVIVTAVFGVASSILIESSLSFLGLGDASAPSWGEILSQGRAQFKLWLILTPGLAIFFMVSIFNLVGEGLQDAMDPKQRR